MNDINTSILIFRYGHTERVAKVGVEFDNLMYSFKWNGLDGAILTFGPRRVRYSFLGSLSQRDIPRW